MQRLDLPFAIPPYSSDQIGVGGDDAVNVRIEKADTGGRVEFFYQHTPALKLFCTQSIAGPSRGFWQASNGRVFQVAGATLWEIYYNGNRVNRGTITTADNPVGITDDGLRLVVMDGTAGYTLTFSTNVFAAIADPDFPNGAVQCWFIDQYIVCLEPNSIYWRFSEIADATVWPALNRVAAEGNPDWATAICVNAREVWVGGSKSFEVFYDSGDPDAAFTRINGAVLEVGIVAPYSLDSARGRVFFLGGGETGAGRVWASNGLTVEPISTKGIDGILATSDDLSNSFAKCHTFEGNTFYVLTVPSIDRTLVYDVDLNVWHERAWMDPNTGRFTRWRGQYSCFGHGRVLVGDSFGDAVYSLSLTDYADDKPDESGTFTIRRRRTTPFYEKDRLNLKWLEIELQALTGYGTTTGQGSDPEIMIRTSNDGLQWSNERRASLGALGNRLARCRLMLLGMSRLRKYRFEQTDPVPVAWQKLWGTIEAANS
ncbi:hypothetical protein UFOVP602_40 [uncultured Caudovirales phage]|uniref:Bacteriophage P22, Gp10, DNA-stabilising n=1 Tax=uncultured Caudovirales phage TaxID=2100421 RepID=A0A6J5N7D9_9CAUD|nr:hypothetical protein UFOVP602_40 [uncultured Caudovirales phage]